MSSLLCKVFRFVLQIFSMIVSFVAAAITTLGDAVVDVLSDLLDSVGDAVGDVFGGSSIIWGVLALGVVYLLLSGGSDDEDKDKAKAKVGVEVGEVDSARSFANFDLPSNSLRG